MSLKVYVKEKSKRVLTLELAFPKGNKREYNIYPKIYVHKKYINTREIGR